MAILNDAFDEENVIFIDDVTPFYNGNSYFTLGECKIFNIIEMDQPTEHSTRKYLQMIQERILQKLFVEKNVEIDRLLTKSYAIIHILLDIETTSKVLQLKQKFIREKLPQLIENYFITSKFIDDWFKNHHKLPEDILGHCHNIVQDCLRSKQYSCLSISPLLNRCTPEINQIKMNHLIRN